MLAPTRREEGCGFYKLLNRRRQDSQHHSNSTSQLEPPTLSIAEMDRDPHGVFRRYRPVTPLTRPDDGSYIVIRANDVERLTTDPRTRLTSSRRYFPTAANLRVPLGRHGYCLLFFP